MDAVSVEWEELRTALPYSRYRKARSIGDRVVCAIALLPLLPLLCVIAIAIKLDSGGPVLFRQLRGGYMGRPFTILKFRTMSVEAPAYSYKKVMDGDPRVTRVGRLLRRTGLDELPQLWNVVRGDMSLIGPRPEQLLLLSNYEPWMQERHLVRPGMTGWWQVHQRDGQAMHFGVDKDIYYLRHQGLLLDAIIVWRTLSIVAAGFLSRPERQGTAQPSEPLARIEGDSA